MGWTRSITVNTGKHSEVETFSGAALPSPWGSNSARHIANKHLAEFQRLDASLTLENVVELGQSIASKAENLIGTPGGRKVFEEVVNIGGKQVTVRTVLNTQGKIRSVHIRQ